MVVQAVGATLYAAWRRGWGGATGALGGPQHGGDIERRLEVLALERQTGEDGFVAG